MEKILKILIVLALLLLVIVYMFYFKERRFREFFFSKRIWLPPGRVPEPHWFSVELLPGEDGVRMARDEAHLLTFHPEEGAGQVLAATVDAAGGKENPGAGEPAAAGAGSGGTVVARIAFTHPIDALLFDEVTKLLYCFSREGVLTIIKQRNRDSYKIVQQLSIPRDGKRLGLDPDQGKLYVYAGEEVYIYTNGAMTGLDK